MEAETSTAERKAILIDVESNFPDFGERYNVEEHGPIEDPEITASPQSFKDNVEAQPVEQTNFVESHTSNVTEQHYIITLESVANEAGCSIITLDDPFAQQDTSDVQTNNRQWLTGELARPNDHDSVQGSDDFHEVISQLPVASSSSTLPVPTSIEFVGAGTGDIDRFNSAMLPGTSIIGVGVCEDNTALMPPPQFNTKQSQQVRFKSPEHGMNMDTHQGGIVYPRTPTPHLPVSFEPRSYYASFGNGSRGSPGVKSDIVWHSTPKLRAQSSICTCASYSSATSGNTSDFSSGMELNSSGEERTSSDPVSSSETDTKSSEFLRVPHNTPDRGSDLSSSSSSAQKCQSDLPRIMESLENLQSAGRSVVRRCQSKLTHNEKERKRRSRIKSYCDLLKALVPGVTEKTDKATVLECTAKYLVHMKQAYGEKQDKEFLEKVFGSGGRHQCSN